MSLNQDGVCRQPISRIKRQPVDQSYMLRTVGTETRKLFKCLCNVKMIRD